MMKTYGDMVGITYGELSVKTIFRNGKIAMAACDCSCGRMHDVRVRYLQEGSVKSCGCLQLAAVRKLMTKYNYNQEFFESNTPEMFYVLGLYYTDGNLTPNRSRFRLGFKAEDKYLLEIVGELLRRDTTLDYNKASNAYELSCTNQVMYSQLMAHGLTPRKSKTIEVKNYLINNSHFWRGVIDGNGWVTTKGKSITLGLCGTINFCESFKLFCDEYIAAKQMRTTVRNINFAQITFSGLNALKILEVIYQGKGPMYMRRKFNKYIDFLKGNRKDLVL